MDDTVEGTVEDRAKDTAEHEFDDLDSLIVAMKAAVILDLDFIARAERHPTSDRTTFRIQLPEVTWAQ